MRIQILNRRSALFIESKKKLGCGAEYWNTVRFRKLGLKLQYPLPLVTTSTWCISRIWFAIVVNLTQFSHMWFSELLISSPLMKLSPGEQLVFLCGYFRELQLLRNFIRDWEKLWQQRKERSKIPDHAMGEDCCSSDMSEPLTLELSIPWNAIHQSFRPDYWFYYF